MIQRHLLSIQKVLKRALTKVRDGSEPAANPIDKEVEAVPDLILAAETLPYVANA